MNSEDRELGMGRAISRRDFVNGVAMGVGAAAAMSATGAYAQNLGVTGPDAGGVGAADYPPVRYGLRGDHANIYTPAHALRDGKAAPEGESTGETYDLVVVGGGLSGLAAAWFFREKAGPKARVLVIENHDDFGGHAKRNEYDYEGMKFLTPGGSSFLVNYTSWPYEATRMIEKFGIVKGLPGDTIHEDHFRSLGMGSATLFKKEVYGKDQLIKGGTPSRPTPEFLAKAPLAPKVKADMLRLMGDEKIDYMPGLTADEKIARLRSMSYRDYLLNVAKVDPEVLKYTGGVWCLTNDTVTAWFAMFRMKPGFAGLGLKVPYGSPESKQHLDDDYRPPGGNHSIARMMVRDMIPDCLPAGDYMKIETERFDYATLDRPGQATRIRLQSTVVRAKHVGGAPHLFEPDNREVEVTYVGRDGRAYKVMAKDVVMAGFNNMIPYICPEIAAEQKAALHKQVRTINVQMNMLVRNWTAFDKLKVSNVAVPKSFISSVGLQTPRTFGAMKASLKPEQPALVTLGGGNGIANEAFYEQLVGKLPPPGTPSRDQQRLVRAGLYRTPYETFEREIRSTAARALGGGGFDPARDIVAITVNRWGHGYCLGDNSLFDPVEGPRSYEVGRQKFGHITIANSDASGIDNAQTAIDEAARAVRELEPRMYGYYGLI